MRTLIFLLVLAGCSTTRNESLENLFSLAVQQMKMAEYSEAIRNFREVIKLDPRHVDAHNNLGIVYAAIGEYETSEKMFQQALTNSPYKYSRGI